MARPLRPLFCGAIYHVFSRGNNRSKLYYDDADYVAFLRLLRAAIAKYDWQILAFCLMRSHFHLVVRTPEPNLSGGMQLLKGKYAPILIDRHDLSGARYEGRYGHVLIETDEHLWVALRYVALNPVEPGAAPSPWEWRWSSCAELHSAHPHPITDFPALYSLLDEHTAIAHSLYVDLVNGDDTFTIELDPSSMRPRLKRPPLEEIDLTTRRDLVVAHCELGYSLAELAGVLGLHPSSVGRRIQRYRQRT